MMQQQISKATHLQLNRETAFNTTIGIKKIILKLAEVFTDIIIEREI
jgi:hypothetical protein